ncbi:MAG: metal ABC transporter substrate-binding protein [Natrialbaceae archaeon]|nr:metal ABC transporter substrate-binding protein [Natrialbaceae archaeon]
MSLSRRSVLTLSAGTVGLTVGCLNAPVFADNLETISTALFPLEDWTGQLVGDEVTVSSPVEVGRTGHGWEPSGGLAADIARSNAFVYFDHPEFAWAQDIAAQLERDYDSVAVIDVFPDAIGELEHDHESEDSHDHDDDHTQESEDNHNHDEDHDNGEIPDPHVWTDPILAQSVVEDLGGQLADIAEDRTETLEQHATAYTDRLAAVSSTIESTVGAAPLDALVFAGHNSFGYFARRYDLTVHTPVGVSPNAVESPSDVADLIETIDDHGITTVLYDPFAAQAGSYPQLVDVLLENSGATDALPLTSLEGTTQQWVDRDWGWVEQMEQINIPALEAALSP